MAGFGTFLLGITGPVLKKVMGSLGLGVISYTGLSLVTSQIQSTVTASYATIGGPTLQLLDLLGVGQAFGIVIAAIVARAAYSAFGRVGVLSA